MNLNYFIFCALVFLILQSVIINYKCEKLNSLCSVNHELVMHLLVRLHKQIVEDAANIEYKSVEHYKDLKAAILHNAAEFYRLREQLKAKEEKELSTLSPVMPATKKVMRGRLRLEEEAPRPPESDSETSGKPI